MVPTVIVRPMLGDWEVPRIERIGALDRRRLARVSVPGLDGDLHHDLGAHSLIVEIEGSLHSDEERDEFLTKVREPFLAGDPLAFVADITTATKLEQVVVEFVAVEEVNDAARPSDTTSASASTSSRRRRHPRSTTSAWNSGPSSTCWPISASPAWSCPTCWATSPQSATPHRPNLRSANTGNLAEAAVRHRLFLVDVR